MRGEHGAGTRAAFFLIVLLGIAVFLVKGYRDERTVLHFRDFKQPYASARCLLHGCNPYDEKDTHADFLRARGKDEDTEVFRPYSALYPPFSLAMLAPVAALNYPAAHLLWFWTIGLLFSTAAILIADLCLAYGTSWSMGFLLAVFTGSSTILLMLGQISGPVIALLVIGFWCLLRERLAWIAVIAFVVALLLKPHDSALLVCYLVFAGARWRRAFFATAIVTAMLVVGSVVWCQHQPASSHWLGDLTTNLKGNAQAGGANDPSQGSLAGPYMANLQPLFAAGTRQLKLYNLAARVLTLVLIAAWSMLAWRTPNSPQKHVLGIASMACIMLLPIYHRQYDTRILLLVFPAIALLLAWRFLRWGVPGLLLLTAATVMTSHTFLTKLTLNHELAIERSNALQTVLRYRPLPEIELVLAVFLLLAFGAFSRDPAYK